MRDSVYTVKSNRRLAEKTYEMVLSGDTAFVSAPGQFVNIKIDGLYLRRPISLCSWKEDSFTLIYKVVGKGTAKMAGMKPGTELDILTGLGNGFHPEDARGKQSVLIGGGVGVPPLYGLAGEMIRLGMKPTVVLGFNSSAEVFYAEEFRALGLETLITTVDGSMGEKGFVTDALRAVPYEYYFCCGPTPMLKAVWQQSDCEGQLSLEERMGCGFGACMGCSCRTLTGNKRVCTDGPVFQSRELLFQ